MRTFLALELPEEIKMQLSNITEELRAFHPQGIKWIEQENIHITLQFIGETKTQDITDISNFFKKEFSQISKIMFSSPSLQIVPGRNPRIIWIHLETENKEIYRISKNIKSYLQKLGYSLDKKPLRFHITLGRIKKRLPDFFIQTVLTKEILFSEIEVTEATFYQSILRPQGPVYNGITNYIFSKE